MSISQPHQPQEHGATAHGTDRAAQDPGRAYLDADLAWGHHLLLVGADIEPDDIEALALSRFAGASRRDDHTIDLLPGAWLTGPWALDQHTRTALGLPEEAIEAYLARAPVLRSAPVPTELLGLGGLLDVFPDGQPEGVEAEVVDFLAAIARRLGGALRAGGTGLLLVPDPAEHVDLIVYSAIWLEPQALEVALAEALPGLRVLDDAGSAPLPLRPPAPEGMSAREHQERAERHARADAFDAEALAAEPVHESYGAVFRFPDDGVVSVQVEACEDVPTVLLRTDWAEGGLLSYALRWYPVAGDDSHDEGAAPAGTALMTTPDQARAVIEDGAAALLTAVGGVVTDDDGFIVDLDLAADAGGSPDTAPGGGDLDPDPPNRDSAPGLGT